MGLPKVKPGMFLARHKTGLQNGGPLFATFPERRKEYYLGKSGEGNWVRVTPEEAKLLASPAKAPEVNKPGATPAPVASLDARFLGGETLTVKELQTLAESLNINPAQKKADLIEAVRTALELTA